MNNKNISTDANGATNKLLQDLFILQALSTGMKVADVRKILKIDKARVTAISKYMPMNDK